MVNEMATTVNLKEGEYLQYLLQKSKQVNSVDIKIVNLFTPL